MIALSSCRSCGSFGGFHIAGRPGTTIVGSGLSIQLYEDRWLTLVIFAGWVVLRSIGANGGGLGISAILVGPVFVDDILFVEIDLLR